MFDWIPSPIGLVTAAFSWGLDKLKSAGADLIKEAFQWMCGMLLSGCGVAVHGHLAIPRRSDHTRTCTPAGSPAARIAVMRTLASGILMLAVAAGPR